MKSDRSSCSATRWLLRLAAGETVALPEDARAAEAFLRTAALAPYTQLLPALVAGLKQAGLIGRISAPLRATLLRRQAEALGLYLRQGAWLDRFIRATLPAAMPMVLLKGWSFNGVLYPVAAPRVSGDIDLLVRADDYEELCGILHRTEEPVAGDPGRDVSVRRHYESAFWVGGAQRLRLDVHRALVDPRVVRIDHDRLWQRTVCHPAHGDERVRMMAPEDAFLHLAANALFDQNLAPHALVDACRLVRTCNPDASILMNRAGEWGIGAITGEFMRRLSQWFGVFRGVLSAPSSAAQHLLAKRYLPVDRRTPAGSRAALRVHQVLSLGLLDHPMRVAVPFLCSYAGLRVMDAVDHACFRFGRRACA